MHRLLVICGLVWVALSAAPSAGQQPNREPPAPASPPNSAPTSPPRPGGITESTLGPIYVKDKDGMLVFLGMTYEEVKQLIDLQHQQKGAEPRPFSFVSGAMITGTASDLAAELEFKIQVELHKTSSPTEEWVRIPLRLTQAVLLPSTSHTGPGEFAVDYDPKEGYLLWLRAPSGTDHSFTLQLRVPLVQKNGARQLTLRTPDTTTKLRLTVSGSATEPKVNVGNLLDPPRRISAAQTELQVDAIGGDLELSWRHLEELPPVLAAFGNISISLDGRQLEFDAQLSVQSYSSPIDSFIVRLPPGAELIATNQQPRLEYLPQPESESKGTGRRFLVRRLDGKTSGPIEARFTCTAEVTNSTTPWQIGGFEVLNARHQKGTIDVTVNGDWSIDWQPDANVRRVDDVPDVLRQQKLAARFEYDRQPFSLLAPIREKKTRITVEPTWLVSVDSNRITLDGTLKYRITGARAKPLELETGGWKIDQVLPAELVAGEWQADDTKLIVPLSGAAQNGGGEFELRILATREHSALGMAASAAARLPREQMQWRILDFPQPMFGPKSLLLDHFREHSGEVAFGLPRPSVDAGIPAFVVISPADNIELSPVGDRLRSLINDTLPAEIKSVRQQQPFVYREDAAGPPALFVGQFRVRPQSILLSVETRVKVEERESAVDQRFRYSIANEPLNLLRFLIPRSLADSGRFELLVDGVATSWTKQLPTQPFDPAQIPILIEFRDPRIGTSEVIFRYRPPHERPSAKETKNVIVPLIQIQPDEITTVSSHRLRTASASTLAIELLDKNWTLLDDESDVVPGELVYESTELPATAQINAIIDSTPAMRSTEVSRVWVQSLLTAAERRDRACFRITTNEQTLTFVLPAGAVRNDITVAVNGQRTNRFTLSGQDELRVELGESIGARETTVELWYWFVVHPVPIGRLTLQAPLLAGAPRTERAYWQLVLPQNEHLAWHAPNLTSENSWGHSQILWSRRPHRSQSELESWVGASTQSDLTRESRSGFNTYLFSSVGSLSQKTVYTMTRPTAVLMIGGLILLLGAAFLYQPVLRHPLSILVLGIVVIGFGVAYPEPALAMAQLTVAGLVLVLVTGVLMAFLSRPAPKRAVVRATPQPDSRASKPASSRSVPAHLTTATLQPSVSVSATGNEP